jgi:general secretion pathway protein C
MCGIVKPGSRISKEGLSSEGESGLASGAIGLSQAGACGEGLNLEDQSSVVWVRRGVETELGVRQTKPRAGGEQKPASLLVGLSLSLFALVTVSWVIFHSVGTSQESSAAIPASAPDIPGSALLTTVGLLAAGPLPEQSGPRSSRLRLTGVIATKAPDGPGIALISVGDGAANPFRVGTLVNENLVLKSVGLDRAELGPVNGSATLVLELTTDAPVVAAADRSRGSLASAAPKLFGAVTPVGSARGSNGDGVPNGLVVVADAADSKVVDDLTAQRAREAQYSAAATRAAARRLRIQNQRAMR